MLPALEPVFGANRATRAWSTLLCSAWHRTGWDGDVVAGGDVPATRVAGRGVMQAALPPTHKIITESGRVCLPLLCYGSMEKCSY